MSVMGSHISIHLSAIQSSTLTLKLPDKLQPYGLYVYYVVHICDVELIRLR